MGEGQAPQVLKVRNWEKWQSYRKGRGQPPWLKLWRRLLRKPKWVRLSDQERGQLTAIWLLAADEHGTIPADPVLVQKLCFMDSLPDLRKLVREKWLEGDLPEPLETPTQPCPGATVAPAWRQPDASMAAQKRRRKEGEKKQKPFGFLSSEPGAGLEALPGFEGGSEPPGQSRLGLFKPEGPTLMSFPVVGQGPGTLWDLTEELAQELDAAFPSLVIEDECRAALAWILAEPGRRKTAGGMRKFLTGWLTRSQNRGNGRSHEATQRRS